MRILALAGAGLLLIPTTLAWLDVAREATGMRYGHHPVARRVIVLGFDGVDPDLVSEFLNDLPNVSAIAESGTLTECRTTNPPESPVAWATFATGMNPGRHGIFDFVRRDPDSVDPYRPLNGMVDGRPPDFGPFGFPLRPPSARNLRGGEGFWMPIARAGYRVSILRMPLTFPPDAARGGEILCGLGVPDLRGTQGSYTLFRAGPNAVDAETVFGGLHKKIYLRQNSADSVLEGPPDPRQPGSGKRLSTPLRFTFAGNQATVSVDDAPAVALDTERFSEWIRVEFRAGPFVRLVGMTRFLLLETGDEASVYASPIQIAPGSAPLPISAPRGFAKRMAERLGPMKTAGWPEDTFAANERVLNDVQAFADIEDTYRAHERLLLDRLDHANASLCAMVFTAPDRASHLFFRYRDTRHPAHDPRQIAAFQRETGVADPIRESYRWMDQTLGAVRERLRTNDVLIVVSDHGFHTWRQGVNLNTWLLREGYLFLKDAGAQQRERTLEQFFRRRSETSHIDWEKTRAYAMGLGQIYLNLKGREARGIVDPTDRDALLDELTKKLAALRTPDSTGGAGTLVFTKIHRGERIWSGSRMDEAPDLQCAFANGFRVSWQTALLGVPPEVFETNTHPWSGDHCSNDADQTAGFFLSNKKLSADANPGLEDLAATICKLFDVDPPTGSEGRALPLR